MATLIMILNLLPLIVKAVQMAEDIIPLPGSGKAKLDFVLGVVTDTFADASKIIPAITAVVARIVSLFNTVGLFKSTNPVPTV